MRTKKAPLYEPSKSPKHKPNPVTDHFFKNLLVELSHGSSWYVFSFKAISQLIMPTLLDYRIFLVVVLDWKESTISFMVPYEGFVVFISAVMIK